MVNLDTCPGETGGLCPIETKIKTLFWQYPLGIEGGELSAVVSRIEGLLDLYDKEKANVKHASLILAWAQRFTHMIDMDIHSNFYIHHFKNITAAQYDLYNRLITAQFKYYDAKNTPTPVTSIIFHYVNTLKLIQLEFQQNYMQFINDSSFLGRKCRILKKELGEISDTNVLQTFSNNADKAGYFYSLTKTCLDHFEKIKLFIETQAYIASQPAATNAPYTVASSTAASEITLGTQSPQAPIRLEGP